MPAVPSTSCITSNFPIPLSFLSLFWSFCNTVLAVPDAFATITTAQSSLPRRKSKLHRVTPNERYRSPSGVVGRTELAQMQKKGAFFRCLRLVSTRYTRRRRASTIQPFTDSPATTRMIANARMYSVSPEAAALWRSLLTAVIGRPAKLIRRLPNKLMSMVAVYVVYACLLAITKWPVEDGIWIQIPVWPQSDNVTFEQSRNVPLTTPSLGDARRTATDEASR